MPESHVHASKRRGDAPDPQLVASIADTMHALSTPSRVALLYALRDGDRTVGELAAVVGVTPAATSQQLRVLRHLRLVVAEREGQSIRYRLHDEHLRVLLDEIRNHAEHAHVSVG